MGDWFPDGTEMLVDPEADVRPLDLCVIRLRKDSGPFARFSEESGAGLDLCKAFLRKHDGAVLVCQLEPVMMALIPEEEIEAIHRIAGFFGVPSANPPPQTRAAMRMVEAFCD